MKERAAFINVNRDNKLSIAYDLSLIHILDTGCLSCPKKRESR